MTNNVVTKRTNGTAVHGNLIVFISQFYVVQLQ